MDPDRLTSPIVYSISESGSENLVSPAKKRYQSDPSCSLASSINENEDGFDKFKEDQEASLGKCKEILTHQETAERLQQEQEDRNLKSSKKMKDTVSSNEIRQTIIRTDAPTNDKLQARSFHIRWNKAAI